MINEIKEKYMNECAMADQKRKENYEKIAANNAKIAELKMQNGKLEQQSYIAPSWVTSLVIPIAEELAKQYNLEYEIFGPFGMNGRTSIYLMEDEKVDILKQKTKSITLQPGKLTIGELYYETGEKKEGKNFKPTSIAGMNGFDQEIKRLPETIEEIISIIEQQDKNQELLNVK